MMMQQRKRTSATTTNSTFLRSICAHFCRTQSNVPSTWRARLYSQIFDTHSDDEASFLCALWYYISPMLYVALGAYQCNHCDVLSRYVNPHWPWKAEAILCMCQGLVSWLSDVKTFGQPSWTHVCDRIMAPILTAWFCLRTCAMLFANFQARQRWQTDVLLVVTVPLALWVFIQSVRARRAKSYALFLLWHGLWHITLPFVAALYVYIMVTFDAKERVMLAQ